MEPEIIDAGYGRSHMQGVTDQDREAVDPSKSSVRKRIKHGRDDSRETEDRFIRATCFT